jgi:TniQ
VTWTMPLRQLPRSLDPLPGEALDGYLLRLAYRLELSPARIASIGGLALSWHLQAPFAALLNVPEESRQRFAFATRLQPDEVASMCLSSLSERYAPISAASELTGTNRSGYWVFKRASRYCPECLAGDGSRIQEELGGAWQKTWRLPVLFACINHKRFLSHLCPGCERPAHNCPGSKPINAPIHPRQAGLHPAQCRLISTADISRGRRAPLCAASFAASPLPASFPEHAVLKFQDHISTLLDPGLDDSAISVGTPSGARRYFVDLQVLTILIRISWPRAKNIMSIADSLDRAIWEDHEFLQRKRRGPCPLRCPQIHSMAPLNSEHCAAVLTLAGQLLDVPHPGALTDQLVHLLRNDTSNSWASSWKRDFLRLRSGCSTGLSRAVSPVLEAD